MATNLRLKNLDEVDDVKLHYMPCKIEGNEAANVSKYFETYIRKTGDNEFEGSFRGYPLRGKEMSVPEGYKGITISEHKKPDSETENRNLYITGKFSKFNYWNYDKLPSDSDALKKALDWIDFAKAIHTPIEDESAEKEIMSID